MEDVGCYPNLNAELIYRGYSDEDIEKILFGNIMRVLETAESVSKELKKTTNPSEETLFSLDGVESTDKMYI